MTTAPPARAQRPGEGLARVQRAEHVDLEVPAEVVGVELVDRPVLREHAGGVDQDVQAVEPGGKPVERRAVGDVDRLVAVAVDDVHGGPARLQQPAARRPDPRGSARDDGNRAVQSQPVAHTAIMAQMSEIVLFWHPS